ncbi:MAG: type II toxin-antitoxin system HipA family toxin [Cellulomonadaceae bacterium]|nr:type II toxin-antitoxin system HipA family toxin [Cellulomonadaceae bacterium]
MVEAVDESEPTRLPFCRTRTVSALAKAVQAMRTYAGGATHQEDFTQALVIALRDKYETTVDEHRLAAVAAAASAGATSPTTFARDLLSQVTFDLLIGNGDAHSKKYSLSISDTATYSVAALYGVTLLNPVLQNSGTTWPGKDACATSRPRIGPLKPASGG